MVKVRLSRAGAKKSPFYHIVVIDSQSARDGRFIEEIGMYDPSTPIEQVRINHERLAYWAGVGAQISDRVSKVVRDFNKATGVAA